MRSVSRALRSTRSICPTDSVNASHRVLLSLKCAVGRMCSACVFTGFSNCCQQITREKDRIEIDQAQSSVSKPYSSHMPLKANSYAPCPLRHSVLLQLQPLLRSLHHAHLTCTELDVKAWVQSKYGNRPFALRVVMSWVRAM